MAIYIIKCNYAIHMLNKVLRTVGSRSNIEYTLVIRGMFIGSLSKVY